MVLCKNDDETIYHVLVHYPYTKEVPKESLQLTGGGGTYKGTFTTNV